MDNPIDIQMLKEKIESDKETKKEMLAQKLSLLAALVRNKDEINDSQIRAIMQNLLDYRKICVAHNTIDILTSEDDDVKMDKLLELL